MQNLAEHAHGQNPSVSTGKRPVSSTQGLKRFESHAQTKEHHSAGEERKKYVKK